jgi:hypothetical protein
MTGAAAAKRSQLYQLAGIEKRLAGMPVTGQSRKVGPRPHI